MSLGIESVADEHFWQILIIKYRKRVKSLRIFYFFHEQNKEDLLGENRNGW